MKFLILLFLLQNQNHFTHESFIDSYIDPSVVSNCGEIQQKINFKYAVRLKTDYNFKKDVIYLFTENKVYAVPQFMAALAQRSPKVVLREIFFNKVFVKPLTDFWNSLKPENESYNSVFADWHTFSTSYWLLGDKYREIKISLPQFKVVSVGQLKEFSESKFGFMRNTKIKEKGFENIFGVDFAYTWSRDKPFQPIRIYARDLENNRHVISFSFYNYTLTNEEFENGKRYNYSFDTAVYLSPGRSFDGSLHPYNHYFEIRTRKGTFSLFDFAYNIDCLLNGANEELLGCPPSFCQTHRFDDIIRLHNGKKFLIYREWMWNFTKPGDKVIYSEAVISNICSRQHKADNFKKPFLFGIRHIVDGSFIHEGILYIFRNGSFIESENDTIIEERRPFDSYKEIGSHFNGVPTQFYDAIFYHKESKIVYFIIDNKYWAYSMGDKKLVSDGYPKGIETLGLPHNLRIKATYVEEDVTGNQIRFYFFTDAHYIYLDASQFKNGKFDKSKVVYFCTSTNFLGCPENEYFACPPLQLESETKALTPVFILIGIIFLLVAMIAMILLFLTLSEKQNSKNSSSQSSHTKVMPEVKISGIFDASLSSLSMRTHINETKPREKSAPK